MITTSHWHHFPSCSLFPPPAGTSCLVTSWSGRTENLLSNSGTTWEPEEARGEELTGEAPPRTPSRRGWWEKNHVEMYKMYRCADKQREAGRLLLSTSSGRTYRKQVEAVMTSGDDVTQTPGAETLIHVCIYKKNQHVRFIVFLSASFHIFKLFDSRKNQLGLKILILLFDCVCVCCLDNKKSKKWNRNWCFDFNLINWRLSSVICSFTFHLRLKWRSTVGGVHRKQRRCSWKQVSFKDF